MGFFRRLFGGRKQSATSTPPGGKAGDEELFSTENDVECPHISLGAHWDNAADVGKHDKITGYVCGGCMKMFSVEETEALRATEAERLAFMKEQPPVDDLAASGPPPGSPTPG
jgi:hypothetical protein